MSPNRRLFSAACIAASVSLAACAQTPQSKSVTETTQQFRGALSGAKQQIAQFTFVNPDCVTGGYPTLKVAKPPQHGQITIEEGTAYPEFAKDNVRSACNSKKVPSTLVFYTSEPGYVGSDSVALDRIGVLGAYGYHEYTINVR